MRPGRRSHFVIGSAFVLATACAAVAGLDYEICEGVQCDGTLPPDSAAPDDVIMQSPRPTEDAASRPREDASDAGADVIVVVPVTCPACPKNTPQRSCVDGGCIDSRRVFVSSTASNAAMNGPDGADNRCQTLATTAGLGGQWRAWISNQGSDPDERFNKATVAYRLLDGTLIAMNWTDLTDGTLAHSIDIDERGVRVPNVEVWTGTRVNGESYGQRCNGFTNAAPGADPARVGITNLTDGGWTETYTQFCDRNDPRIYCFEQ